MFFYIDESGHTGTNLFDPAQPILYYGILSSKLNIDVLAEAAIGKMCKDIGVSRLHAKDLGVGRLVPLIPQLLEIQKRLDLRFDLYRIAKADYAIISFFDQVFDQGLNPAITWTGYWTPLRYMLLMKVASLFDEEIAKKAWAARIDYRDESAIPLFQEVCEELRRRVPSLPDVRSRQLVDDGLHWAQKNPTEIHYHVYSAATVLDVTPNVIGFQSVLGGIALRIRKHERKAMQIVVDQQSQFNQAQKRLSEWYAKARTIQGLVSGPGMPRLDFRDMPGIPLRFEDSKKSAGLTLADIYLWIYQRYFDGKPLAPELEYILHINARRGLTDEISLNAIGNRWSKWFDQLPEPSAEAMERGAEIRRKEEERRSEAIRTLS